MKLGEFVTLPVRQKLGFQVFISCPLIDPDPLFPTPLLEHVEGNRPDITLVEFAPRGSALVNKLVGVADMLDNRVHVLRQAPIYLAVLVGESPLDAAPTTYTLVPRPSHQVNASGMLSHMPQAESCSTAKLDSRNT